MQKNRLITLGLVALGAGAVVGIGANGRADAQVMGTLPAFVRVQTTTPGTAQSGHSNITGTAIAGQFIGSGGGLTNVNANLLDGLDSTAFLQAVPNPLSLSGSQLTPIITGTNSNAATGTAGVKGVASSASGTTYGLWGTASSSSGRGVFGEATATTGLTYGGRFESAGSTGRGVYGLATGTGATFGLYGVSQSPTGRGVRGSATATSGVNYGGYFDSASTVGYGVYAGTDGVYGVFAETNATTGTNYGVYGQSASTAGRGVYGMASSTTGNAYGVFGESQSASGRAVVGLANATSGTNFGGYFDSDSASGYGVWANSAGPYALYASSDKATGTAYGVYGESSSTEGRGVFGTATSTSGVTMGVRGEAFGSSGTGVWGEGDFTDGTGVYGSGSWGVYGIGEQGVRGYTTESTGAGVQGETFTVNAIGVLGVMVGTNPAYAVYASGKFGASGTKSFRIDHPQDPENKYLLHYSTESPFPQNFYSGNVVTNAQGKAWVTLPDYFHEVNVNYKYQLTVVDNTESSQFVQVKVAREIANGRFLVMTSAPMVKVSWRVEADRNDLSVRESVPVDVQDKPEHARGKYQVPRLYGKPENRGEFYSAKAAADLRSRTPRRASTGNARP